MISQPSFDTPADSLIPPPGIQSFIKNEDLKEVAVGILIAVREKGVCSIPKGSRQAGPMWNSLRDELFLGVKNSDGTRDNNGVLRGYKMWETANSATAKLKPLVLGIITHFGSPTGPEEQHSALELLAEQLKREMNAAEKKKEEKANEKAAQRIQNETAEAELGYRTTGYGVKPPSLGREMAANEAAALSILARQTQSVCQGSAVSSAAATAAAASAILTPRDDASRSHAVESLLASLAAGNKTVTKETGSLETIKKARNLDRVDLMDSLESSLDRKTDSVMNAFQMFANSPNTKRQKTGKSIQERINLTLHEIKELKALDDPEFEADLKEAKDQLRRLYKERKSMNAGGVAKNLHCDLTMSDDE